jgi:hypothetical protein
MLAGPSCQLTSTSAYSMLFAPGKGVSEKMLMIRLATEEDIPSIVELYHQLAIASSQFERSRNPSPTRAREMEVCREGSRSCHSGTMAKRKKILIIEDYLPLRQKRLRSGQPI